MHTIGFYYNCYKNKFATDNVLKQLRKIYPTEPVYLLSDCGDNFADIALKYNCFYKYSPINILGGRVINGKKHMCFTNEQCAKAFLSEIINAIEYCKTDYIILMEDDVFIHDKVRYFPQHAGGDTNIGNKFRNVVHDFTPVLQTYPNIKFDYWNLAGGSILHCNTIKECIENTSFEEIRKFDYLCKTPFEMWHINDVLLNYLLMIHGKTSDKWVNTQASMISHPDKRFYTEVDESKGIYRV
jgi:hypothetical protein